MMHVMNAHMMHVMNAHMMHALMHKKLVLFFNIYQELTCTKSFNQKPQIFKIPFLKPNQIDQSIITLIRKHHIMT